MRVNPYKSPKSAGQSPGQKIGRILFGCIGVACVVALLVALLLPATRSAREPARRSQCRNNLKEIGLALLEYEEAHHALPPAYTLDANGKPLHSWRTLILPFMGQQELYKTIDLSKPWDDPANKTAFEAS